MWREFENRTEPRQFPPPSGQNGAFGAQYNNWRKISQNAYLALKFDQMLQKNVLHALSGLQWI